MKYRVLITAMTAGLIGITTAQAQAMHDKGDMFGALDADGNGELSEQELSNMREAMAKMRFESADTNSDGRIDKGEFMAKAKERAERMFKHMDRNDDGMLDADEAQPSHHGVHHGNKGHRDHHGDHDKGEKRGDGEHAKGKMLERMDSDDNGSVSKAEWDSAMERAHDRHEQMKDAQ